MKLRAGVWQRCWGAGEKEIVFTGGGTESDNLAILGTVRASQRPARHVITSAIEHPAVLNTCAQLEREGVAVDYLPVGRSGIVDPDDVRSALRPDTVLITIMHANNEIGTIQPIAEIAAIAREAGVCFHSDGVQAAGRIPVNIAALGVDLYSISAHKFYGPKGAGALYVRKGTPLAPILFGGHHERDRRAGTENVPALSAMGVAAANIPDRDLAPLRDRLESAILNRIPVRAHKWRRQPAASKYQQHLFRLHRRRTACHLARPARLRHLQRIGMFERRSRTIARPARDRTQRP